ncbi:hypothetical protein [Nocardia sp. NPDC049149]|uniref:hypothetical protein n=1 Tax=Nocardia sp. NPDC049149 TaxID=3364315 RepID=UPI003718CD63
MADGRRVNRRQASHKPSGAGHSANLTPLGRSERDATNSVAQLYAEGGSITAGSIGIAVIHAADRTSQPAHQTLDDDNNRRTQKPNDLPRPQTLIGRDRELSSILEVLDKGNPVKITGSGGIGKTSLAVAAGWAATERFTDGTIMVDLRGEDDGTENSRPKEPLNVAIHILERLGLQRSELPSDRDHLWSTYRTTIAQRNVLVILDNARSTEQVQPLIHGGTMSATIVTSRSRLYDSDAFEVFLQRLSVSDGLELFCRTAGIETLDPNKDFGEGVVNRCGSIPTFIRLAARRFIRSEYATLRAYDEHLRVSARTLLQKRPGEMWNPNTVFQDSYDSLTDSGKRALHSLGIIDWPSFPAWVSDINTDQVPDRRAGIEELLDLCLLDRVEMLDQAGEVREIRYSFHDLTREFSQSITNPAEWASDLAAIASNFIARGVGLLEVLEPGRPRQFADKDTAAEALDIPMTPGPEIIQLSEDWFDSERECLTALMQASEKVGLYNIIVNLGPMIPTYFIIRGLWTDWRWHVETAARAARIINNQRSEAYCLQMLTNIYRTADLWPESRKSIERSLYIFEQIGDPIGIAYTLIDLAITQSYSNNEVLALTNIEIATEMWHDLNSRRWQSHAQFIMGEVLAKYGHPDRAQSALEKAVLGFESLGDVRWSAYAEANLVMIMIKSRQDQEHLSSVLDAIDRMEQLGDRKWAAVTRLRLASILADLDLYELTSRLYEESTPLLLRLKEQYWDALAQVVRAKLLALDGQPEPAIELLSDAKLIFLERKDEQQAEECEAALKRLR